MSLMYCPKCKKNVETKKEEFRVGLAILLVIFTGGLGLLIYVAIYLDKSKKEKCVHCNTDCIPQMITYQPNSNYQSSSNSYQIPSQKTVQITQISDEKAKFCFSCGVELDQREEAKFCRFCGTNIN